jgi:peroxiredoxin
MAHLTFKGQPAKTVGNLPTKGQKISASGLVKADLSEASLDPKRYSPERCPGPSDLRFV